MNKRKKKLKVKKQKKILHVNSKQKGAEVAILISDKTDFMFDGVERDKEGQYLVIKGENHPKQLKQF